MFIQTETTPNPSTLKFIPGRSVLTDATLDYRSADEAAHSPLAKSLFHLENVSGVFLGGDFISVTKSAGEWQHLRPAILGVIMEHFLSDRPVVETGGVPAIADEEYFAPEDAETVSTIKELLETRIRPAVAGDGGDIGFKAFRDGVVYLTMRGSCSGCPSSTATLKHGIQNLLRHYLPNVRSVEAA